VKICSDLIDTCLNKVLSLPYKINVCLWATCTLQNYTEVVSVWSVDSGGGIF
jgi:hypothetical protein